MDDQSFIDMLEAENKMAFQRRLYDFSSDEDDFSSDERFTSFYSSLRDGIQDAYMYRQDFETWKKYRVREQDKKPQRKEPVKSKLYSRTKAFSGEKISSEEKDFTPEQEIRFARFYSDLRDDLEEAYFRRLRRRNLLPPKPKDS
jgi:hypothetical protein